MEPSRYRSQPLIAGILTALVGFTSSSAIVLTGLRAVGASPAQAASGLLALCATQGIAMIWLASRHRMPLTVAWSTPGAALLASTGVVRGGWPAAVGAFLIVAGLIMLTGLWPRLGRLVSAIPAPIAQAMLAGIVLDLCLTPMRGLEAHPWEVAPVLAVWVVLLRLAPKWAVPAAFAVTLAVVGIDVAHHGGVHGSLLPHLDVTAPAVTWPGLLAIAIPLYIVTMAGQNIPGVAVMASHGYQVPWRETMAVTGAATAVAAPVGGHALNLAAITASLAASPDAHPDPGRRWVASVTAGWCYLALGLVSAAVTTLVSAAPADVVGAVAGLALLGTLSASLSGAMSADQGRVGGEQGRVGGEQGRVGGEQGRVGGERTAAAVTFVVAASGLALGGIGAAFWALLAGLLVRAVLAPQRFRVAYREHDSLGPVGQRGQRRHQMRVVMLAPPGAGKGTQGERIAARYGVPHISSGDIFRAEVASGSPLGNRLRGYLDAGDLVPDDLVIELMTDRVIEAAQNEGGYVLDGFPRTLPQAEAAAEIARKAGVTAQVALYLDAPPEVLVARLTGRGENRTDDSAEVARHRLEVYAKSTQPLIDYYTGRGIVVRVDAAKPIDEVSEQIFAALDPTKATEGR
jgi:benzoate membrane transport protein